MAAYISFQPSDFFNPVTFVGNQGGVPTTITGVGFQPDFCWFKNREVTNDYWLFDSVRGVEKYIECDTTQIETTDAQGLQSFNADGFTVGDANPINHNLKDIICWNWKAGTTTGLTGGTITPDAYSINTTSGFGMYKYGGNSTSGATIAHGLGKTPKMIFIKNLDIADEWIVYHNSIGNTKYMILSTTAAQTTASNIWNDTSPTSTVFSLGNTGVVNTSNDYMAYVWADVKGYSKFGSYTGNGNADGTFIYTGFRPAYLFVKQVAEARSWNQFDFKRSPANVVNDQLVLNSTAINEEKTMCDFVSNGFKARATDDGINKSSQQYVYAAFAEFPIVSSNDVPVVAR